MAPCTRLSDARKKAITSERNARAREMERADLLEQIDWAQFNIEQAKTEQRRRNLRTEIESLRRRLEAVS